MAADFPQSDIRILLEPLGDGTPGVNDLEDERVVGLLVRGYVDQCLALFQKVIGGELGQDAALDGIYGLAAALNEVFLGRSGFDTVTTHPWNSPDQLGAFMRDALDLDFPPEESVRAGLIHLATQIMYALQGAQPDWNEQVEAFVIEMRDLLLGRPTADGDDEPLPM